MAYRYDVDRTWPSDTELDLMRQFARRGDLPPEALAKFAGPQDLEPVVSRYMNAGMESPERTAIHEAGHAVMAHIAGFDVKRVEMSPDSDKHLGFVQADLLVVDGPEPRILKVDRVMKLAMNEIGGYSAENLAFGPGLSVEMWEVGEKLQAELQLSPEQRETLVTKAEASAEGILRQYWGAVEAIAAELLTSGKVDGAFVSNAILAIDHSAPETE